MTERLRKTGIPSVGDIPWGTHFCHFYETDDDLLDILIPYFKAGLENNEFCMWVVFPPRIVEEARQALTRAVPDFDRRLAAGDIEILPHTQWYLKDDVFDPQRVINGWLEKLDEALSRGYDGIRLNGNEAWLRITDWKDFSEYEERLNKLIADRRMIVLCTYPLAASTAAEFLDVARTHEFAIARRKGNWEVLETPALKDTKAQIGRLNEELERRVAERTRELAATNQELRKEIIERRHAEEALRESEEKYRLVVDKAQEGILIAQEGMIRFVNPKALEMLGYSEQELLSMPFTEFIHPDDREMVYSRHVRRLTGEQFEGRYSVRISDKAGAERLFEIEATTIFWHGSPAALVFLGDITDRKRAEEERIRLVTAIEQAAEAVVVTDAEGTIVYANPSFVGITGYSREEVIGNNPRILKSGRHDDRFYKHMWETITSGEVWSGRIINKRKDGTFFEEEGTISPIKDDSGRIVNYVAVKRDVTKEVSLQAQLEQAHKMEAIGTLAGGIAHDFNNLLQVTLGYSELMLQDRGPEDKDCADLQKIYHAAKSGTELVQRLLTFSRKVESKPIPLNLNRLIVQVEKLLRRTIPKMIDIQIDLSDDLAEVNVDPTQVEQILMNLAVNARDAMPDRGKLTIATKNVILDGEYCKVHVGAKPGAYVMLSISDTGHGMPKETIEHIFEPFYTTKELGRGTGLGLAMVYGIVKQHNGLIGCYSEVGHGTTFTIYFPAIETLLEADLYDSGMMPAFGTETILLVDDEDSVRDLGSRILSKAGYRVLTAVNGTEALDILGRKGTDISLVILDLIMPEMGGKECLIQLRKIDPQLKVLIASGYPADPAMKEPAEISAQGFVNKPFRIKELLQQVRKILDES